MKKIVRISCVLKWAAFGVCSALPLVEAGYWITNGYPFLEPFIHSDPLPSFGNLPIGWESISEIQKLLGFFINMIPLSFSMIALASLAKLFDSFARLELFEKANVQILKQAGWVLVCGQLIHPIYFGLLSLALTYRNPVGERNISIALGTHQMEVLAIGLSILLASWVFEEAVKIREEQAGTI